VIYGVGLDVSDNVRIRDAVERWADKFLRRVFTEGEIKYCAAKVNSVESLSARFAAKEAFIKAAGMGFSLTDIEVVPDAMGKPSLKLHGRAREAMINLGITAAHVSLTHQRGISAAVVVLEG
jgi:holo-[acyl-carrier protein] synthase